ncbi:hypothetical protein EV174_005858, partial [Coemansia sp. RSA 2320]
AGLKLQTRRQHLEQSVDALRVSVQKLAEKSAGVSPKDSSTSSASPSHSRSSSLTTVCDNPSSPAPLKSDEALANLRRAEAAARRLRDDHEDVIQELKAERSRWMAQLSNVARKIDPAERTLIEPMKRDLAELSRKLSLSHN